MTGEYEAVLDSDLGRYMARGLRPGLIGIYEAGVSEPVDYVFDQWGLLETPEGLMAVLADWAYETQRGVDLGEIRVQLRHA